MCVCVCVFAAVFESCWYIQKGMYDYIRNAVDKGEVLLEKIEGQDSSRPLLKVD